MSRKNKILVPEARKGLDQLKAQLLDKQNPEEVKYEIAEQQGVPLNRDYNGDIKAKEAGQIGGHIGGQMVKELVKRAQNQMEQSERK